MKAPPAAGAKDKMKEFFVNPGYITADNDGVRKEGGDTIMLTHKQAQHFVKQGVVSVELEPFGGEEDDTEDTTEAGSGDQVDSAGESDVRKPSEDAPAPVSGNRKAKL